MTLLILVFLRWFLAVTGWLFPPTYVIDCMRHYVLGTELIFPLPLEIALFFVAVGVLLVLGGELWKKANRKVREGGLQF